MGKVKRLELWWQLYRTSLPVWDLENFRPMDFCWHACTSTIVRQSGVAKDADKRKSRDDNWTNIYIATWGEQNKPAGYPNRFIHECNLADGGGSTMGIRNLNLRGIQVIKRVKIDWFEPVLNVHTPLPPTLTPIFFNLPLFNSVAKRKLFLCTKMVGGEHFLLPKIHLWPYTW